MDVTFYNLTTPLRSMVKISCKEYKQGQGALFPVSDDSKIGEIRAQNKNVFREACFS